MKRSDIDAIIDDAIKFIHAQTYKPSGNEWFTKGVSLLPEQAFWTLEEWHDHRLETAFMKERRIGWDITDFGSEDFEHTGLVLYTLSNGLIDKATGRPVDQSYAKKLMVVNGTQETPMHHHWHKTEDITNLGGAPLNIDICNAAYVDKAKRTMEPFDQNQVVVYVDCVMRDLRPGLFTLNPGQTIRLEPHHYHAFWGVDGKRTLLMEVSDVNDDSDKKGDNCFNPKVGRFPVIEENAMPRHLLCTELPGTRKFYQLAKMYLK